MAPTFGERQGHKGLAGLLNLVGQPHWTIILSDFPLSSAHQRIVTEELAGCPTRVAFHRFTPGPVAAADFMNLIASVDDGDYLSVHLFATSHESLDFADPIIANRPHWDFTRLELPLLLSESHDDHLTYLLNVLSRSDFAEQQRIAACFYAFLSDRPHYEVEIVTPGARLTVLDDTPWFQLAGPLTASERRILPGGEVAYTGSAIDGDIRFDGGLLAVPSVPAGIADARAFQALSARFPQDPLTLTVERGRITAARSPFGETAEMFEQQARNPGYRVMTEVGISFNSACSELIHDWPAASNEGRPGVHLGIGGDPDPDARASLEVAGLAHVDLIARTTEVYVNGKPFLQTR